MNKIYYKLVIVTFLFFTVKSYSIELNSDFLYGGWETEVKFDTIELQSLTLEI